jgi:hypothetical protein
MTKQILERAKTLDGDIAAINKLLRVLSNSPLRIASGIADVFQFVELDKDTYDELLTAMNDVLKKRKSTMINELEEL